MASSRGKVARSTSLVLVGLLAGAILMEPVSAHLGSFNHLKNKHFYKKKAVRNRSGRTARMTTNATLSLTGADQTYGPALSILAPRKGFILVSADITFISFPATKCPADCNVLGTIRHIQSGASSNLTYDTVATPSGTLAGDPAVYGNTAHTYVFPVSAAGVNTFDLRVRREGGLTGTLSGWYGEMTALFVPYGSTGSATILAAMHSGGGAEKR